MSQLARPDAVAVGICVNPMSGRDVRRLAARATTMTHEAKRDIVARIGAGAAALGATDLFVAKEPFRIATAALEHAGLAARVHVLDLPITNSAVDTEASVRAYLSAGCSVLVSVGGDGTNRAIVRALEAARRDPLLGRQAGAVQLIALSTGTNNVFPTLVEPTVAGMAAAIHARGDLLDRGVSRRCKVLHVGGQRLNDAAHPLPDVGLIDAVLLGGDFVGNLLPFDVTRIEQVLLTRALPASIGMSPIGGLIDPVDETADQGLLLDLDPEQRSPDARVLTAPLSPGWLQRVRVRSARRIGFDVPVAFSGPGVLALDGDRDHKLGSAHALHVEIRRDGPLVVDVEATMRLAAREGLVR